MMHGQKNIKLSVPPSRSDLEDGTDRLLQNVCS